MEFLTSEAIFANESNLPDDVKTDDVVRGLHNHANIMRLNPFMQNFAESKPTDLMLSEWKLRAPDPNGNSVVYDCEEKLPGWGRVDFKVMFQDLDAGYFCMVHAPLGTKLYETVWLDTDNAGNRKMKDRVLVRGNTVFFPFIKRSLQKARSGRHADILDVIRKEAA